MTRRLRGFSVVELLAALTVVAILVTMTQNVRFGSLELLLRLGHTPRARLRAAAERFGGQKRKRVLVLLLAPERTRTQLCSPVFRCIHCILLRCIHAVL